MAAVALCCGLAPLRAQTSATVSGTVTDASGAVVSGATVTVTSSATGAVREATSGGAGRYNG